MTGVSISVPARPEFIQILRGVVSSVAARLRFGFEEIDDLRLAVDEAAAHLLTTPPEPTKLNLRIAVDGDRLAVTATRDLGAETWPPSGARQTLAWKVLTALTDEARFETTDQGPGIQFTKRSLTERAG